MKYCKAKAIYRTREACVEALRIIKQRAATNSFKDPCRANRGYFCDEHECWHLTKMPITRETIPSDVMPGDY